MKCAILLFALFAPLLQAQMFTVVNQKGVKFNQEEADRAYKQAVDCVRSEYHIVEQLTPTFILVLGMPKEQQNLRWPNYSLDWDGATISMGDWNPRLFRKTVVALAVDELLRPQNIIRLADRLDRQDAAMVSIESLKQHK